MTDAVQIFPPGFRVTDDVTGAPVSGAKIKFYDAGTTTPKTVYSNSGLSSSLGSTVYTDSMGAPVASSGSNTAVMVYTGTAAYKVVITTSDDDTILSLDNIKGALDTSTFLTTGSTSTLTQPVISKTSNYTIVAGDRSKLIEADPTGGQFTLTLTAAATLGDNWSVKVRHAGTSNQVIVAASQTIKYGDNSFTSIVLKRGESFEILCDGTGFKIFGQSAARMASRAPGIILIVDRVTSDPSATAGDRYIVQTGYGSFATGDVIESNGSTFNKITPQSNGGWLAYVQDEQAIYQYRGSAWTPLVGSATLPTIQRFTSGSGTYTPTSLVTRIRVRMCGGGGGGGAQQTNDGTAGNTTTFGSWTAVGGGAGKKGGAGIVTSGGTGGTGGTDGTGNKVVRLDGAQGGPNGGAASTPGGCGGTNPFGGSGSGGTGNNIAGNNGATNTGAGGGGGGGTAGQGSGSGGGAGEYVEFWVTAPTATSYTVGATANGGSAGGVAGGNGAAGIIVIEEFYP